MMLLKDYYQIEQEFINEAMLGILNWCKTRKVNTTAYHPQTNGLVERLNKTLANILSKISKDNSNEWSAYLSFATYAYDVNKQETIQHSPFMVIYDHETRLPGDPDSSALNTTTVGTTEYMTDTL